MVTKTEPVLTNCVSYSLTIPKIQTRDTMSDAQFDAIMEKGYQQAQNGQSIPLDDAFAQIREGL